MTIGTRLFTWFNGELVGRDEQGNRYYQARSARKGERRKRWVMYEGGKVEASRVPAHWHGWLHYTHENPPASNSPRYSWQKPHQPNQTGTAGAYLPPGHTLKGGQRASSTADYEAWRP